MQPASISYRNPGYPAQLRERLGDAAPDQLTTLGNLDLLALPKTGLFCSARCPGNVILSAYDQAARWRDAGRCIISGFHSPVEQECLRILLRGTPPIILCPARALPRRIPAEWQTPLADGRLLILSGFTAAEKRVTVELATRRNALVAALADEVCFAHITPGGQSDLLTHRLTEWRMPFSTLEKA
ncbi:MAG: DNA-processing protein DprA [Verrucomicrobia bacterium]|nr:DNA-processing protein DprA [Verrucomicrobiota bacterium]